MKELIVAVVGGVLVIAIASWFGIGQSRTTVIEGVRVRKSGKWIIFFSVIAIIGGLAWAGSGSQDIHDHSRLYGYTLAGYGVLAFIVGKVVAWFQKL